jgi:hypothetical protein
MTGDSRQIDNSYRTAAVFSSVLAIFMAGIYALSRFGIQGNPALLIVETVGIGWFVLLFPCACRWLLHVGKIEGPGRWFFSDSAFSLLGFAAVSASGFAGIDEHLAKVFGVLGFCWFVICVVRWVGEIDLGQTLFLLAVAAVLSICLAGGFWGNYLNIYSPLFVEGLMARVSFLQDGLISSSITSMIEAYGIPSTGLDGVPYCSYHWLAYWFFAGMARLIKTDALTFIQLGFPVVVLPWVCSRFLVFVVEARRCLGRSGGSDIGGERLSWIVLLVGCIGFVPADASAHMRMWHAALFHSMTYTLGLAFALVIGSLCTTLYRFVGGNGSERPALADHMLLASLPILLFLTGLIKISQMYLLLVCLGYMFLRCRLWSYPSFSLSFAFCVLSLFLATKLATNPGSGLSHVAPFSFFTSLVPLSWKPFFFLFSYFWSWFFIGWQLNARRILTVGELGAAVRGNRVIDIELVVVVCVIGSGPAFLFAIPGTSGVFFIDFQNWFSLALILAYLGRPHGLAGKSLITDRNCVGAGDKTSINRILAGLVLASVFASVAANLCHLAWGLIANNVSVRCLIKNPGAEKVVCATWQDELRTNLIRTLKARDMTALRGLIQQGYRAYGRIDENDLRQHEGYEAVKVLQDLRSLPRSDRRETLLFIPRSNNLYWDLSSRCQAVPFIAPSLAGIALLDGLPKADCALLSDPSINHYGVYRLRRIGDPPLVPTDCALYDAAKARGFGKVLVMDRDPQRKLSVRSIQCPCESSAGGP